jgi:hypothetical protein
MSFVQIYWLAVVELLPMIGDVFVRLLAPSRTRVPRVRA